MVLVGRKYIPGNHPEIKVGPLVDGSISMDPGSLTQCKCDFLPVGVIRYIYPSIAFGELLISIFYLVLSIISLTGTN